MSSRLLSNGLTATISISNIEDGNSVVTSSQPPPPKSIPSGLLSARSVKDNGVLLPRAISKVSDVAPTSARENIPDADIDNLDWKQYYDEASGQVYYYNEVTGESSWELNPYKKLPCGWREYYTEEGYPYYYHEETGKLVTKSC